MSKNFKGKFSKPSKRILGEQDFIDFDRSPRKLKAKDKGTKYRKKNFRDFEDDDDDDHRHSLQEI